MTAVGPISGSREEPEDAIERLTQDVMGRAATFADPVLAPYAHALHLPNYAAFKEGMKGAELFLSSDYRAALPYLDRAAKLDPSCVWPLQSAVFALSPQAISGG
jgi:hypothetical protein